MQVPRAVAGRDVRVSLSEGRSLEIVVGATAGAADEGPLRIAGLLSNPAKGFGNGSVWELVSEGSGKVRHLMQLHPALLLSRTCKPTGVSPGTHSSASYSGPLPAAQLVNVTLEKETPGKWWSSVLKGGPHIDLHTIPGYDPPPFDSSVFSAL
jgi:hypothetical protein